MRMRVEPGRPPKKYLVRAYEDMKKQMSEEDKQALGISPKSPMVMGDVRMKDELKMRQSFADETIRKEKAKRRREQLEKQGKRMA